MAGEGGTTDEGGDLPGGAAGGVFLCNERLSGDADGMKRNYKLRDNTD